jgi:hypothetical protein
MSSEARQKRPIALVASACVAVALMVSTCGLEYIPYLTPPELGGEPLTFGTATGTDPYFRGYEIYYKLYPDAQAAAVDNSLQTELSLLNAGFLRLTAEPTGTGDPSRPPLIEVPPGIRDEPHIVTVEVLPCEEPSLTLSWDPEEVGLRRGVTLTRDEDTTQPYQTFQQFDANDEDTPPDVWSVMELPSPRVVIGLYALSYGFDAANLQPIRSEPTYLFTKTIDVGVTQ